MFVLHLFAPSVSCVSIVLKFIVILFNMLKLGMPNKPFPFPGTTQNLHIFCLLLGCNHIIISPKC